MWGREELFELDGDDAVVGRGVENQRKRTELEDGDACSLKRGTTPHFDVNHSTAKSRSFTQQCRCEIVTSTLFWNGGFKLKLPSSLRTGLQAGPAKRSDELSKLHISARVADSRLPIVRLLRELLPLYSQRSGDYTKFRKPHL
jgi:hypothetical protein